METLSVSPVILSQRPVTRSFDVFFDLRLNQQWRRRWFETPLRILWRHCNVELKLHGLLATTEKHRQHNTLSGRTVRKYTIITSSNKAGITVRCRYNAVNFLINIHKNSSPVMTGYGVSFCGSSIWLIFCLSFCNYSCNTLQYWTAL